MTTATTPTLAEIADILDTARAHIVRVGFCKKYLYSTPQQANGLAPERCAVDLPGAIAVAVHGTPLHPVTPLTAAVEQAVAARITAPSLAAWCDYKGNGKQQALDLLRATADRLRNANRNASKEQL
ncbi:hypothetical protein ACFWD7_48030 [Streptomyces mirabilis]|uniref:DUF6197 family protein n=1 Tax=Streptomyces mirabilis TaxID=68239 RepID=UPI0036965F7E